MTVAAFGEIRDGKNNDCARSLADWVAIKSRREMLKNPHMTDLVKYTELLRKKYSQPEWEIPEFDPLDGGINAGILFLFEKPGPKTSAEDGRSGFISRNNDDPTAEATFRFMVDANLQRERTAIWNTIPGWNKTRKMTSVEIRNGLKEIPELLSLFKKLRTIILVGKQAQRAIRVLDGGGYRIFLSPHPSPLVRASSRDVWSSIPTIWSQAASAT